MIKDLYSYAIWLAILKSICEYRIRSNGAVYVSGGQGGETGQEYKQETVLDHPASILSLGPFQPEFGPGLTRYSNYNKLGVALRPALYMNHLKQWNADSDGATVHIVVHGS